MSDPFNAEVIDDSFREGANAQYESGMVESIYASMRSSFTSTPVKKLESMMNIGLDKASAYVNDEKSLSPDELNTEFSDLNGYFKAPLPKRVAKSIADQKRYEHALETTIESGPQDYLSKTLRGVSGVVPHALDPLNIVAGAAASKLLSSVAIGSRMAPYVPKILKPETFGGETVANIIGNFAVEPINFFATKAQQDDYNATAQLVNNVGGGVLGTVIGRGVIAPFFKGVGRLYGKDSVRELALKAAIEQINSGKKVNIEPILRTRALEITGKPMNGETTLPIKSYDFTPVETADIPKRTFYISNKYKSDTLQAEHIGMDLGDGGISASDSAFVANGSAASHFNDVPGEIVEVQVSESNLIDLNKPLSDDALTALSQVEGADKMLEDIDIGNSGKMVIQQIENKMKNGGDVNFITKWSAKVKELGYEGYHYVNDSTAFGDTHDPHNMLFLFDEAKGKIKELRKFDGDQEIVPRKTDEELIEMVKAANAKQNEAEFNQRQEDELNRISQETRTYEDTSDASKDIEEATQIYTEQQQLGSLDESEVALFEDMKIDVQEAKSLEAATSALVKCVMGG